MIIALGSMVISNSNSSNPQAWYILPLFVSSSISFISVLVFRLQVSNLLVILFTGILFFLVQLGMGLLF